MMATDDIEIAAMRCTLPSCPVQYEGELTNGLAFYFRARHEGWCFGVGRTVDEAINAAMSAESLHDRGWTERMRESASYMRAADAEALIRQCVRAWFAVKRTA